ncbi:hypothetical protein [Sphingomonas sp. ACRSK]|uniref:hypothetical protein n=1 Tax=Sphingomonas sp. ACRSK TaxID=2918213 RepID=UPI001EF6606A|nr:hypothetical protein [Sphingomonas sp. ACRSK]MCG7348811.1 hypothetical protein [Sphingomonas sp. ACRSK]
MFTRIFNWLASFSPAYHQAAQRAERERRLVETYAMALRDIVNTTAGVKVPNGTTRKVNRIANEAFERAWKGACA